MHIGLIGGIGPAATGFYYRNLVRIFAERSQELELTIAHANMPEVLRNIVANDAEKQAESFLKYVRQLEAAGANVIGVTSIAAHFCIDELRKLSPLPIVDAIAEVRQEIGRKKLNRVGLLGTKGAMGSRLFESISPENAVLPQGNDLERVHDVYVAMATNGSASEQQRDMLFSIGKDLCRKGGAESVVLAGTDLFLAFEDYDCRFPTIDCAVVHAEALYQATQ